MKSFQEYLNEMSVNDTSAQTRNLAKQAAGFAADFIPGVSAMTSGMKIAKGIYDLVASNKRAKDRIKTAMLQADNSRDAENYFDLDDNIAAILSPAAIDTVASRIDNLLLSLKNSGKLNELPKDVANKIAKEYIQQVVFGQKSV